MEQPHITGVLEPTHGDEGCFGMDITLAMSEDEADYSSMPPYASTYDGDDNYDAENTEPEEHIADTSEGDGWYVTNSLSILSDRLLSWWQRRSLDWRRGIRGVLPGAASKGSSETRRNAQE